MFEIKNLIVKFEIYLKKILKIICFVIVAYPVDQEHSTGRDVDLHRAPAVSNSGPQITDDISTDRTSRTKRQSSWAMVSGPCLTGRGTLGKCTSFRLCYPHIKMPNFQYWDSWMMGMYDTCTYISMDHKQVNTNIIYYNM